MEAQGIFFGWDWPLGGLEDSRRQAYFIPSKVIIKLLVI